MVISVMIFLAPSLPLHEQILIQGKSTGTPQFHEVFYFTASRAIMFLGYTTKLHRFIFILLTS
jgi:hypothetical protein